ncbi:hypothetical protein HLG73_08305 [Lacticaseibacillus paracasei]|uniref:hypothetical protein n=1 Tax=Lacticaseibacillus paracasei TaxID=1597 RepID=UPI001892C624|nr:hypothetical protein [Lacticaseibacillus paracasei]QPC20672.1 hypothetical protein LacP0625_08405 [Lacticaseibacillus paracasei subsp. tolerans]WCZ19343.1 hypothetical protein HLG73_08305 [Lacticaseibacillus paracasei]
MRERNRQEPQRKSRNKFLIFVIGVGIIVGLFWVKSGVDNPSNIVPGKIFEIQTPGGIGNADHLSIGYIAFGSKQQDFGCVYLLSSKKDEERMNDSGKISANTVKAAHAGIIWTNRDGGNVIECPFGLAVPIALDSPMFPKFSLSIKKVSGIFTKSLEAVRTCSSFLSPDKIAKDNVKLVQVGTIKETQKQTLQKSVESKQATTSEPSKQESRDTSSNTIGENNSPNIKVTPAAQFSSFAFTNTSDKPITIDPRAIMPVLNYGSALKVPNEVLKEGAITIQPGQTHNYPNFFGNAVQNATSLSIALDTGGNVIWNWKSSN